MTPLDAHEQVAVAVQAGDDWGQGSGNWPQGWREVGGVQELFRGNVRKRT